MIRRPPRSTQSRSSAASDVYKRQPHDSGTILIDGVPVTDDERTLQQQRCEVGMVFQQFNLFPHLTALQNITLAQRIVRRRSAEEADRVARELLERVGIPEKADSFPGQLSGGQQQRIAVARALVFEPDPVLMDEPLAALDKQLREQMQYEIKHIHERLGVTIVYVTHDQAEALTMSNRIAVFNDGVVQQLSTPDELYERPQNSFVAQFIGENNKLKGVISEVDRDNIATVKLDSSDVVKALAVNVGAKGERTLLSIRPERVEINPLAKNVDVLLRGRIAELIYLGDHIRARLEVAGHDNFIVKVPNKASNEAISHGKTVNVGWSVKDCRALDFIELHH